jgi:hypothetical protein
MVPYRTVFDASVAPFPWEFPAFGLVLVTFVILFRKFAPFAGEDASVRRFAKRFLTGCAVFGVLWTIVVLVTTTRSWAGARRTLAEGSAQTVEGPVEDFVPQPANGKGYEQFRVGTVVFKYSKNQITEGFRQTTADGGPIRPGLPVRIHYIQSSSGPTILKLELAI